MFTEKQLRGLQHKFMHVYAEARSTVYVFRITSLVNDEF